VNTLRSRFSPSLSPLALAPALALALALAACDHPEPDRAATAPAPCAVAPVASAQAPAPPASIAATPPAAPPVVTVTPAPFASVAPSASAPPARSGAVARPADAGDGLVVKRLVIARGVERKDREPVDAGTTFRAADLGKLYAFVELDNAAKAPSEIVVAFEPPSGQAIGNVTLDVGATPHWRTWAYTRAARQTGAWTAVVKTTSGRVIARAPFEITS
jgi:hypothetical protein